MTRIEKPQIDASYFLPPLLLPPPALSFPVTPSTARLVSPQRSPVNAHCLRRCAHSLGSIATSTDRIHAPFHSFTSLPLPTVPLPRRFGSSVTSLTAALTLSVATASLADR